MSVERLALYRTDDPFTRIPNSAIHDAALDLKALGMLVVMLSKPDGWRFTERNLASQCGVGRAQVRTAIGALVDAGYVARETVVEDGRPVTVTRVADVPRWREGSETGPSPGSGSATVGVPDGPETGPPSNERSTSNDGDPSNDGSSTSGVPPAGDEPPADPLVEWPDEVRDLVREFARFCLANGHTIPKRGTAAATGWLREMDRLLRLGPPGDSGGADPPSVDEVRGVMRYAMNDVRDGTGFPGWGAVIRSVGKFREQYSRLRIEAKRASGNGSRNGQALAAGYAAAAEELRARQAART